MKTLIKETNPLKIISLPHAYTFERIYLLHNDKKDLKVLDYGAYNGKMLETIVNSGLISEAQSVELNADIVKVSKDNLSPNHTLQVINKHDKLPFSNAYFDVITIMGVVEHVHNQDRLLLELNRVLKQNGSIIIAVPGKHFFSFLDFGNWKFIFPKIHKLYIKKKFGEEYYDYHYVKCANGLIGDVEVEKRWHQHFTHKELESLLQKNGFQVNDKDGFGFFYRLFHNIGYIIPFLNGFMKRLIAIDAKMFSSAEIFVTAYKK
jgi:SAM-dependent methyltransferase